MSKIFVVIFFVIIFIGIIMVSYIRRGGNLLIGGGYGPNLSPRTGPVDMLIEPKQLIMDGYRFQNVMFSPISFENQTFGCLEEIPPRIGVFKKIWGSEELQYPPL